MLRLEADLRNKSCWLAGLRRTGASESGCGPEVYPLDFIRNVVEMVLARKPNFTSFKYFEGPLREEWAARMGTFPAGPSPAAPAAETPLANGANG